MKQVEIHLASGVIVVDVSEDPRHPAPSLWNEMGARPRGETYGAEDVIQNTILTAVDCTIERINRDAVIAVVVR